MGLVNALKSTAKYSHAIQKQTQSYVNLNNCKYFPVNRQTKSNQTLAGMLKQDLTVLNS